MTWAQAILLGLIQGITEFLPISSSAHLILVPFVLGWEDHGLRFDIVTNAGTLLAAVVYFRHDLAVAGRQMLRPTAHEGRPRLGGVRPGLAWAVLVASVPVLVIGLTFLRWIAGDARHPALIASASIAFGVLLWWADRTASQARRLDRLTWTDALWIGGAQALALIPGTSRSGITITAALFLGLERRDAARFSFLLAIPVGTLALARDLVDLTRAAPQAEELAHLAIGFLTAGVSAYVAIGWLLAWLRRQGMMLFVVYRVVLGLVVLALLAAR